MASTPPAKTVTREQLYHDVWSKPISQLSVEYGVSDVAILRACKRRNIPTPPRGSWAKISAGKKVEQPQLPPLTNRALTSWTTQPLPPPAAGQEGLEPIKLGELQPIAIPQDLRGCHPIISETLKVLRSAPPDDQRRRIGGWSQGLCVLVGKSSTNRALRLLESLIRACEEQGWTAKAQQNGKPPRILVGEESVSVELTEKYVCPDPSKKGHIVPSGRLNLCLNRHDYGCSAQWTDGKFQRLEDELPKVIAMIEFAAKYAQRRRLENIERERSRAEDQRRREIHAARVKREKQRREQLEVDAANWQRTRNIHEMCDELERRTKDDPPRYPSEAAERWLKWARAVAAKHDPFENGRIFEALQAEELDETLDCG